MGVTPFYKHFKHDGVRGPNMATVYSDQGFGVRAPVVFYNRSNEAAAQLEAGRLRLERHLRGRRPLGAQRRHLRVARHADRRPHRRLHEGGEGARGGHVLRPQLPREAVEDLRRRRPCRRGAAQHRRPRRRAGGQRGGPAEGPRHARAGGRGQVEARSHRVLRDDRPRQQAAPQREGRGDDAARGALDQPPQLERGGVDRRQDLHRPDGRARRATTASAAATGSRRGSSTGCSRARAPKRPSGSAGRTARCSRRSRATRRCRRWSRCGRSRRAGRRASSADTRCRGLDAPAADGSARASACADGRSVRRVHRRSEGCHAAPRVR